MPFKSKSQVRKFAMLVKQHKMSQAEFQKWLRETGNIKKLPERVKRKKKAKRGKR